MTGPQSPSTVHHDPDHDDATLDPAARWRTQISLDPTEHRRARRRAAELGMSFAEYIRRLVRRDLEGPAVHADVTGLFALGDSGGSDVAAAKEAYVAEAVAGERSRG